MKTKTITAFKVVRKTKNPKIFASAIASGNLSLRYRLGKTTKPKIGVIFVFDTLNEAISFVGNRFGTYNVLKGKAKGGRSLFSKSPLALDGYITSFWKGNCGGILCCDSVCDSFTPMEIVKE